MVFGQDHPTELLEDDPSFGVAFSARAIAVKRVSSRTRSITPSRRRHCNTARSGLTLIELMVILGVILGIVIIAGPAIQAAKPHGIVAQIAAGIVGTILGTVLGFVVACLGLFCLALPFLIVGAIRRAFQPADLVCRCAETGGDVPKHLVLRTQFQHQAILESHRLSEWAEYANLPTDVPTTANELEACLAEGSVSAERIALVALLNDVPPKSLGMAPVKRAFKTGSAFRLSRDIHTVLRTGLPPRLGLAWALVCAERALPAFEREFHHDTRPRQWIGAVLMVLRDDDEEAKQFLCKKHRLWSADDAGCRVLHQSLKQRILGERSQGERAGWAMQDLVRTASSYLEHDHLWTIYDRRDMTDAYATKQGRCDWSQPFPKAEDVAYQAIQAAEQPDAERQWQRQKLARMIFGWERWDDDREAWRLRVEDEWIPKILEKRNEFRFNVGAYVRLVRQELVPWKR
ncbi:MAG: hypothetical protein JW818_14505 [Pirellulales bacterium]|nr:hypothetical protein [Pirellulales bacterium]